MILYSVIVRIRDGMALSASTDFNDTKDDTMKDAKRSMKLMQRKLERFPERSTLRLHSYAIHCASRMGVGYLALCEAAYPTVLAFSFLEEIMKEFLLYYDTRKIFSAHRPYAFIDFDSTIQKFRHRYNSPRTLTTRINLANFSTDMKLHPPYHIQLAEVEPASNGLPAHLSSNSTVGPLRRQAPVTWFGVLTTCLASILSLVSFSRGMTALSYSNIEDFDGPNPGAGVCYLTEASLQFFMVYVYLKRKRLKWYGVILVCAVALLCNWYVQYLRELWLVVLHSVVSLSLTYTIITRGYINNTLRFNV